MSLSCSHAILKYDSMTCLCNEGKWHINTTAGIAVAKPTIVCLTKAASEHTHYHTAKEDSVRDGSLWYVLHRALELSVLV